MVEIVIQIKSGITINVECKNPRKYHMCKKDYIWNPSACTCENG